jgi:hypothetical protein
VLVLVADALVVELAAVAVTESAVAPADGASWTPGAVELPQPAVAAASATTAQVIVVVFRMSNGGE